MDKMEISKDSSFSEQIEFYMEKFRPWRIIETGTYLGTGSTFVIASCLRKYKIVSKFYSIEVNPDFYKRATENLAKRGLLEYVTLLNGLSISRSMLPTKDVIKNEFVDRKWPEGIYIDHDVKDRVDLYYKETNFPNLPDSLLYRSIKIFDCKPDFILLDSGGHIGSLEFGIIISVVMGKCLIALDDIYHVKHFDSFNFIKGDKRFNIISESKEKFGYCFAMYHPLGGPC